jgi:hypothetical protein
VRAFRRPFRSGRDIVKFAESTLFGSQLLLQVPEDLRDQARAELEREFERQRTEREIELRLYTTFALAEKGVSRTALHPEQGAPLGVMTAPERSTPVAPTTT